MIRKPSNRRLTKVMRSLQSPLTALRSRGKSDHDGVRMCGGQTISGTGAASTGELVPFKMPVSMFARKLAPRIQFSLYLD